MRTSREMLDRAAVVHRWDCPAVSTEPALPERDPTEANATAAAILRRPYDALRRLVGQAAGLLVLAEASQRREIVDLPAVAVAREQWRETSAMLADLKAPRGRERQAESLVRAARLVGACLDALEAAAAREAIDVSLALDRIAAAYRLIQRASDDSLGMTMVDFRQSCCNCGRSIAPAPAK